MLCLHSGRSGARDPLPVAVRLQPLLCTVLTLRLSERSVRSEWPTDPTPALTGLLPPVWAARAAMMRSSTRSAPGRGLAALLLACLLAGAAAYTKPDQLQVRMIGAAQKRRI